MVAQPRQREDALEALAGAARAVADGGTLADALRSLAAAASEAADAELVLLRVREPSAPCLAVVAAAGPAALAAELEGARLAVEEIPLRSLDDLEGAPPPVRRTADRAGARVVLVVPVRVSGRPVATVELYRSSGAFTPEESAAAELVAAHMALVLRAFGLDPGRTLRTLGAPALQLAGEALAAGSDAGRTAGEVARLAAELVRAGAALLWARTAGGALELAGAHAVLGPEGLTVARELAERALLEPIPLRPVTDERLPAGLEVSVAQPLGQPPVGILQLLFPRGGSPTTAELAPLTTFGVRAAHALRASARAQTLELELARTRALLAVVGQTTAELSLAHTLETAVERVGELLGVEQLAVYLRHDEKLVAAAERGLVGPHLRFAERLLELALGPLRGRGIVHVADAVADERLGGAAGTAAEARIESAIAAPLVAAEEVIGLLALYPTRERPLTDNDTALLLPLAGQLAVAVQNAQLHEQATELGGELEEALSSERLAARRLRALYEISRSFAQSLSLEATLEALATTIVDVLDADAAVIRIPDERREQLVPRALHVANPNLSEPLRTILFRPEPFGSQAAQRLFRAGVPERLDSTTAEPILAPFLERGWTGAVVPVATPAEVIAALTVFSFHPGRPISDETVDAALAISGQAALAIDNARLYQQQKKFADTMQRSLLPRSRPLLPGLEVGEVYESAATVEVGGDIYDFMELADGRLAVVLGDVTGHGIEATADMAMAKFVFRSLAREHSEPGDFLAAANEVVSSEIAPGKFITMVYVVVDSKRGEVACAGAGHPPPRILLPDGAIVSIEAPGLVLGIDSGIVYEEVREALPPGASIVLYTDGVIEARHDGELYGLERLDALLERSLDLRAKELAEAVVADCREFAGGELGDDCAVVVIKRDA